MKALAPIVFLLLFCFSSAGHGADFSDSELTALGRQYAETLNRGDAVALGGLLSVESLSQRTADLATDNPRKKSEFVRGFKQGIKTFSQQLVNEIQTQQGRVVFLRVHEMHGLHGPLVRYDLEGGYNYILLVPVRSGGDIKIGDLYVATNGQLLSETLGLTSRLLITPDKSLLGKLFDLQEVDESLARDFTQLGQMYREAKYVEGYQKMQQLPAAIRNERIMINFAIQFTMQISEELYRRELKHLARYHQDNPSSAFMLLDHYFYEHDFQSASQIVDVMEEAYGTDAVMYILRASIDTERGQLQQARQHAQHAVQLEPDNEETHWTLLTTLMMLGDYRAGVKTLNTLEQNFGYLFAAENFSGEPIYSDFIQSQEFAAWINSK